MYKLLLIFYLLIISLNSYGFENEAFHNKKWCASQKNINIATLIKGLDYEVRTPWRGYVDCLLPKYAIEADWDYKYRDGIIQALEYGMLMNRRAAILLIRTKNDIYIERARIMINMYNFPVKLFIMDRE